MQSSKPARDETSATQAQAVGLKMAPLRAPALKKGPDGSPGAPGDTTGIPNASQCSCACG